MLIANAFINIKLLFCFLSRAAAPLYILLRPLCKTELTEVMTDAESSDPSCDVIACPYL